MRINPEAHSWGFSVVRAFLVLTLYVSTPQFFGLGSVTLCWAGTYQEAQNREPQTPDQNRRG